MKEQIDTPKKEKSKEDDVKVNLGTFIVSENLNAGRKARIEQYMLEMNDTETEKTLSAWKDIYNTCMNRVTN